MASEKTKNILYEERTVRITGKTPLLATQPASTKLRSEWIAKRAFDKKGITQEQAQALMDEENEMFTPTDEKKVSDDAPMMFLRDEQNDGRLFVYDYTILGFMKSALKALKPQLGVAAERTKVDNYLFVKPRILYVMRYGTPLTERDEIDAIERPLRAETMQGPRTALVSSEMIRDQWELEFRLVLLKNDGTARSKALDWDAIETCLMYGELCGIGGWRNASYGQFVYEWPPKWDIDSGREGGGSALTDYQGSDE